MKKLNLANLICLIFLCGSIELNAQNPDWLWAQQTNGSGSETGKGVIVDQKQNAYFIGTFSNTISFDSYVLTSNGSTDVYLAKYDDKGNILWAISGGGGGNDNIRGVAADKDGNAYIIGSFVNSASFSGVNISSNGSNDIFVAKYSFDGNLIWIKNFGGINYDEGVAISVDSLNKIVFAGSFGTNFTIDGNPIICCGNSSFFVAKFDSSGTFEWVKYPTKGSFQAVAGVETNMYGDIYVTGNYRDTLKFDTATVLSAGQFDVFLLKLGSSGNFKWVSTGNGSLQSYPNGMCMNEYGDVYITGTFLGSLNFGGKIITSCNNDFVDIFLVRYSEDGTPYWATGIGGTNYDQGMDVCVDNVNNTYVTGFFNNSITFGSSKLTSKGSNDIFIAKFNSSGTAEWGTSAGNNNYDIGYGIGLNIRNRIFVTGVFQGLCNFGNITLNSGATNSAAFLGVIGQAVPPTINIIVQPTGKDVCYGDEVSLEVVATGNNISYQWKRDNIAINGANSSVYSVPLARFTDAGNYTCELKDSTSTVTTNNAVVTVDTAPVIITQPLSKTVKLGQSVTFSINASGGTVNYQWFKNNNPLPNATLFQYTITSAKYSDSGSYRCAVYNDCGDTVSNEVFLKVNPATAIIDPLADLKIDIYPNPASGSINISFNNSFASGSVQLTNMLGSVVMEKVFVNEKNLLLETKVLPKGYYFVKVRFDNHIKLEKILIK